MTRDHQYEVIGLEETNAAHVSKEERHGHLRSALHHPFDAAAET
jgi:hypothetical protein